MSADQKTWIYTLGVIFAITATIVGGCTATQFAEYEYRKDMAKQGYEEHVKTVPGVQGSVRCWRKIAE